MTAMRIDTLDPSSRPLVESCTTLIVNAFADPRRYGPERVMRELRSSDPVFYRQFFIALQDGRLVGIGGVKAADWASQTHILHLSAVAQEWRGRGIGKALIKARVEWVEANFKRGRIIVSTAKIGRYRELGFTELRATRVDGRQLMVRRFKSG